MPKYILFNTTALAALMWSGSAAAQDCSTSTPAATPTVTTFTCATNTVTTSTTNTNGNAPATRSRTQSFGNAIVGRVNPGVTVSGFGLQIIASGGDPVTFENEGSVINDSGSAVTLDGLRLVGNGGLITYRGNGSVRTNGTSSSSAPAVAIYMDPNNGSGVNIGSSAAPVTGTFTGPNGIYIGDSASARRADVNAFFAGGTFDTQTGIAMQLVDSNINLVTTGNTIIAPNGGFTGISIDGARPNANIPVNISVVTDARIGTASAPVSSRGITVFGSGAASATVSLTGTGSIFAASPFGTTGIQVNPGTGQVRATTGPSTTISVNSPGGIGIRALGHDVRVDAAGAISARDGISADNSVAGETPQGTADPLAVSLTGSGSISSSRIGIVTQHFGSGPNQVTTAAGTSIRVVQGPDETFANGIRAGAFGSGGVTVDVGGTVDLQAHTGTANVAVLAFAINGPIDVTIRPSAVVSASATGTSSASALRVSRTQGGSGATNILNLGTLRGPVAADFVGTLQVGNGGTTGVLEGNVVNNGTLIFNRSDSSTYAGIISGPGALRQAGGGTTTLTGASTFTGGTTVSAGTLLVNGSTQSGVQVDGGTLGGTGSVGATTVASGGRLAPGAGGVGTFTVNGNLVLQSGSTTLIDVTPAGADRINVTGTASIAGGLTAFSSGGTLNPGRYTILNAAGGVAGTFAPFATQGTFPNSPRLEYDANNVVLVLQGDTSFNTLQRDSLTINPATVTARQVNLFSTRLLGRLNGGTPIFDQSFAAAFADPAVQSALVQARLAITNAGAPALIVFGEPVLISRNVTTSTASTSQFTLASHRDTTTMETTTGGTGVTRTRGDTRSCGAAVASLPSSQRPACATPPPGETYAVPAGATDVRTVVTTEYSVNEARTDTTTTTTSETYELNGTSVPVGTIHAAVQSGIYDLSSRFLARAGREGAPGLFGARREGRRTSLWAEGYGFRASQSAGGGLPGERRDAWGMAGGFSMAAAPGIQLGIGLDHGRLDLDVRTTGETAEVELTQVGLTGRVGTGPFSVAAALTYGTGEVDSARSFMGIASGNYDVKALGAFAEARYELAAGGWRIAPVAGLDWVRIDTDNFQESGPFGFIVPDAGQDRTRAFAGLEVGRELPLGGAARLELTASARYLTVLDGEERTLPVSFAAAPGNALVMTGLDEEDSALVGAQARLGLSERIDLYLAYDGRLASGHDAHAGTVGLRLRW